MTKQIIQGTLPSFTGYNGPWVIEKMKKFFVKATQGQVLTVPEVNTILASLYIYPLQSLEDIDNGSSGYSKEYLSRNVTTSTLSFLGSKLYSSHVNSVLGFKNKFADKVIAGNTSKLEEVRFSIAKYTAEQTIRDFYLEANGELVYQDKLLTFGISNRYLGEEKPNENLPKLRFPGFNESYQFFDVNEIGKVQTGNTPSTKVKEYWSSEDDQSKHIWVTPTDISSPTIENTERTLTDLGWEKARKVPANSLLITCIASIGKNTINTVPASFNQQINSLTPKKGFDVYYLLNSFNKNTKKLIKAGASSITDIVNKTQFESFVLRLPKDYKEQQKIGSFFKDIDDLTMTISLEGTNLQNLKKGVIQGLFPDKEGVIKIRSKKYNNSWDESKLESLATFKKGKGYSKGDLKDEGHPIILYGQLYTNYEIVISKTSYTDLKEKSVLSKGNEVIIPASGESAIDIAVASVVKEPNVILGGDINILTLKEKLLDPAFLAIALSNGKQRIELAKLAQGAIIVHLYNEHLKKIKIQYPSLSEQQEIALLICKLAELHARKEKLLAMIAQLKKALLQRMFV